MELIGLVFELVFLLVGIYVYRLSSGKMRVHDNQRPALERFVKENGRIMRILSLALIAMMSFEIFLHIIQLIKR